ncbi:MAG TPA: HAD-IIA family hydrolase [Nocardioidaceae bacterium]|nr:HAD-IIA family hydrolase [Nocardioidaceae bacterium]
MLRASGEPLSSAYDLALLDLDGVVYVGSDAVPGAPQHLAEARRAGMHLAFVTNNASRPPSAVAEHLTELGIEVAAAEVVTAAQAAARLLAEQLDAGAKVFVIGGVGLYDALTEQGLVPVQSIDEAPVAVVSGYHPEVAWRTVIDGAILVKRGLPWVAANMDSTVPTPHGPGPGNGVLVGAVARFADRTPEVAGKPERPLFLETLRRVGGERPLVVGDRLDTDIEGAIRAGYDSLLVMTGVTGLAELVRLPAGLRPTFIAADLGGLSTSHGVPVDGVLGGWKAQVLDGALVVEGDGGVDDWWRVVADVAWKHQDDTGRTVDANAVAAPGSVGQPA